MVFVGRSLGRRPVPHTNIMKTRNVKSAAAFTTVTQPALPTDFSDAAAPAPDGVTVWGGRMADGTLNRFGAESAGGIKAEVD